MTSYNELRREALSAERWNRLHPNEPVRKPYVSQVMESEPGPIIAASDYLKALPDQLAPWLDGRMNALGTDGFGRSENREHLRKFFEVGADAIAASTLSALARRGEFDAAKAAQAIRDLGMDPEVGDPVRR